MENLLEGARPESVVTKHNIPWGSVIAGAVVAVAVSSVLLVFGSAIGLSVASTSPTWRDTSVFLWLVSGLFLIFVALASFGLGGYIAGRLGHRFATTEAEGERLLRDGLSGLTTWGLAVVLAGLITAGVTAISGKAVPAASGAGVGIQPPAASEGILSYEIDRLLRTDRHVGDADWTHRRLEVLRILLTSGGHNGVSAEDRAYLSSLVGAEAKITEPEAAARTDRAIAEAHAAITNVRKAAVLEAFMIGAALLLGAAISWFAAEEGGRERDAGRLPKWDWQWQRPVNPGRVV